MPTLTPSVLLGLGRLFRFLEQDAPNESARQSKPATMVTISTHLPALIFYHFTNCVRGPSLIFPLLVVGAPCKRSDASAAFGGLAPMEDLEGLRPPHWRHPEGIHLFSYLLATAPGRAAIVTLDAGGGPSGRRSCRGSAIFRWRRARFAELSRRPGEHLCAAIPHVAAMDDATGGAGFPVSAAALPRRQKCFRPAGALGRA